MLSNRWSGVLRGLVIVAVLGVWLAIGALGGQAQGKLSTVQTNDSAAFLPSSAESTRAAEKAQAFVSDESLPALVVAVPTDGDAAALARLAAPLEHTSAAYEVGSEASTTLTYAGVRSRPSSSRPSGPSRPTSPACPCPAPDRTTRRPSVTRSPRTPWSCRPRTARPP